MKFFIDTANVDEIREAASLGILDGVTTNPSLVAKEGRDFHTVLREICEIVDGPISAEVTAEDHEGMLTQGRELAKIHENITIKVPLTKAGLQTCKVLRSEGTMVNVTLCFSPTQALLAAKADASSPLRVASPGSTQGSKSSVRSLGKVNSRFPMSPFGSMTIAGTPSIAASSSRSRQRPVLPLPVIPTRTACVHKSFESYMTKSSPILDESRS